MNLKEKIKWEFERVENPYHSYGECFSVDVPGPGVRSGKIMPSCCCYDDSCPRDILESRGYRAISLEEFAKLRIQEQDRRREDYKSLMAGAYVKEAFIVTPERRVPEPFSYDIYISKNPPRVKARPSPDWRKLTFTYPSGSWRGWGWGEGGYDKKGWTSTVWLWSCPNTTLEEEEFENALVDSIKMPAIHTLGAWEVPTERLGEDEVASFLFGKIAQQYGDLLKDRGVNYWRVREPRSAFYDRTGTDLTYTQNQFKPVQRQVFFGFSALGSDYYWPRARGIKGKF